MSLYHLNYLEHFKNRFTLLMMVSAIGINQNESKYHRGVYHCQTYLNRSTASADYSPT